MIFFIGLANLSVNDLFIGFATPRVNDLVYWPVHSMWPWGRLECCNGVWFAWGKPECCNWVWLTWGQRERNSGLRLAWGWPECCMECELYGTNLSITIKYGMRWAGLGATVMCDLHGANLYTAMECSLRGAEWVEQWSVTCVGPAWVLRWSVVAVQSLYAQELLYFVSVGQTLHCRNGAISDLFEVCPFKPQCLSIHLWYIHLLQLCKIAVFGV